MTEAAVPAYSCENYGPRTSRFCWVVFVLNEGDKFLAQLERMRPFAGTADIVIADGGSTDGAPTSANLRTRGVRALLVKSGTGRLGAQMRMAFAWALAEGYEGVITIDGNNKDDPTSVTSFVEALGSGADHVQGSRFIRGGRAVRTPWARHLGIRLIHAPLISLAARHRYTDTTNGFRAYSARLLRDPRVSAFRDVFVGYELHYYLAIRAARLGLDVREVPVTRSYPEAGPVPTKIRGLRGNIGVLGTLLKACTGQYDPPVSR